MQEWLERRRTIRAAGLVVVLVIVAMVQSCSELKYRLWAVRGTADVTEVSTTDVPGRCLVKFSLRDEGGRWAKFRRTMDIDKHIAVGNKVEVEYIPRQAEKARLLDDRSLLWPGILLALMVAAGAWVLWVCRDFHSNLR